MARNERRTGRAELRRAAGREWPLFAAVGGFSLLVNLLMLTGPLFMLQVYDRVVPSGSVESLVALTLIMLFLYLGMGVFDHVRAQVMTRGALRFARHLQSRVFQAGLRLAATDPVHPGGKELRDLLQVRRAIGAPVAMACLDLPWFPIFLGGIFLLHPLLGGLALASCFLLAGLTLASHLLSGRAARQGAEASREANTAAERLQSDALAIRALGMAESAERWWQDLEETAQRADVQQGRIAGLFAVSGKTYRMMLQSGMLGLGALLAIRGELSYGAMFASTILLGRALAPLDTVLGQWPLLTSARESWRALAALLGQVPPDRAPTALPRPEAHLVAKDVTVVGPAAKRAILKSLSFKVLPGQAVGVIGPSGSGKSTLARVLVGAWPLAGGSIRLGGGTLDQYGPQALGQHLGYLPQAVQLYPGSIAQNIARLVPQPDAAAVVRAAQAAGAHEMILSLPDGYDTRVHPGGSILSGGQIQRIGLARAMFGDPLLLVLDEPNASLDWEGSAALNQAVRRIKGRGGAAVIMTHRAAAIEACDLLLVLQDGRRTAFGPRDQVMAGMVRTGNANANANTSPVPLQAAGAG